MKRFLGYVFVVICVIAGSIFTADIYWADSSVIRFLAMIWLTGIMLIVTSITIYIIEFKRFVRKL